MTSLQQTHAVTKGLPVLTHSIGTLCCGTLGCFNPSTPHHMLCLCFISHILGNSTTLKNVLETVKESRLYSDLDYTTKSLWTHDHYNDMYFLHSLPPSLFWAGFTLDCSVCLWGFAHSSTSALVSSVTHFLPFLILTNV